MKFVFPLICLLVTSEVLAAGSGSGSVWDLKFSVINVAIFLGILFSAIRRPLKTHFLENAKAVKSSYERAQAKTKEAKLRMQMFEKKMVDLERERSKIIEEAKLEAKKIEQEGTEEIKRKSVKLVEDTKSRMQVERDSALKSLNANFLGEVIASAKSIVEKDKASQEKLATRLIQDLR